MLRARAPAPGTFAPWSRLQDTGAGPRRSHQTTLLAEGLTLRALLRRRCPLLARVAPRRVGPRRPGTGRHGRTDRPFAGGGEHPQPGQRVRRRCRVPVPRRSVGAFAYVDQTEQRVWFCDGPASADSSPPAVPRALTVAPPDGEVHNHGGLDATPDGDWILAVREVHRPGLQRPVRSVVALSTRGAEPTESTLLAGHDFFGAPRVDAGGTRVAVVVWDHPDMPWDASRSRSFPSPGRRARLRTPRPWRRRVRRGALRAAPRRRLDSRLGEGMERSGSCPTGRDGGSPTCTWSGRCGCSGPGAHGPGRRVPRAGLGPRADDDGRPRRWHAPRAHDRLRTGQPARIGDRRRTRPGPRRRCLGSAVRVHLGALRPRGRVGLIGSTPADPPNVWLWTPDATARPLRPATGEPRRRRRRRRGAVR